MFENPHIIYIVSKHKHEELLAECRMIRLANCAKKKKKKSYLCKIILFIADVLIKSGVSLRSRLTDIDENNDNSMISLEND
ncbi:MAG: hypothetical protein PVG39_23515 [Desulfobacteraceae bacterium]|jgi:hypothetical protein